MTPDEIKQFARAFSELPSIGPRQATRLAFHLVNKGKHTIGNLIDALTALQRLGNCERCFRASRVQDGRCDICSNPSRNHALIAVVEKETDVLSLENAKKFQGCYLVLGELSREGMLTSLQKLRLNNLKQYIKREMGQADEIIVALSPTTYGDLDASVVTDYLKEDAKIITRLGRGLPTGGEIEFADDETLGSALEQRK
ncbi:MAG: recombination protein RecR [Candidatus Harrisonbacteria bacterium CG10_big_fil_rev_8_21_14_0_10_42_17]|uniref:Recombination protein RecR n=1 Tax=Candidatus Harrisonbacteria bacterium CG10_big_fil_rev_8_21_14_0_10_42_17 TaxID=1974584 RepID=A0A2M6WGY0_9BACT|nr:MAG: recombination protein RecR [Candidatus Harrisonbacteria bacterium CG10_big_fil_rev_8_21_14_0_10_42_17]